MLPIARLWFTVVIAVASTVFPATCMAWNKAGHMTSGSIAYDDLRSTNPAVLAKVVELLRQHPQFDVMWSPVVDAPGISSEEAGRRLFMLAARWADDIRGNDEYDAPSNHFIDFPYKPPGQPASVKVAQPAADNLLEAYKLHLNTAATSTDPEEQAVSLCWLFHLTGDVHQPLHTVSLFTTTYPIPEGDRGGTRFYIRPHGAQATVSLHSFWDGLILGSERYGTVKNTATRLRNTAGFGRAELGELTAIPFSPTAVDDWARQESFVLAKEVAYVGGKLKGSKSKTNGVELPADYASSAKKAAERRLVLSGYRLADVLTSLFATP